MSARGYRLRRARTAAIPSEHRARAREGCRPARKDRKRWVGWHQQILPTLRSHPVRIARAAQTVARVVCDIEAKHASGEVRASGDAIAALSAKHNHGRALHRSTVHKALTLLVDQGFLIRVEKGKWNRRGLASRYWLGPEANRKIRAAARGLRKNSLQTTTTTRDLRLQSSKGDICLPETARGGGPEHILSLIGGAVAPWGMSPGMLPALK